MKDLKNLKLKDIVQLINENQKIVIYAIIVISLLVADYKLFLSSVIKDLRKAMPQKVQLQRSLITAKTQAANIELYKTQAQEVRDKLSLYKKSFSTQQQISALLESLSEIAKASDVKITAVKPYAAVAGGQSGESVGAYQKFPIMVKAVCGYHQLGRFLNKLENAETFMRITDIKITGSNDNPREHNVYLVVNTYVITEGA